MRDTDRYRTVRLPSGITQAGLTVANLFGTSNIAANGTFHASVPAEITSEWRARFGQTITTAEIAQGAPVFDGNFTDPIPNSYYYRSSSF